jgi:hypothetical protein
MAALLVQETLGVIPTPAMFVFRGHAGILIKVLA